MCKRDKLWVEHLSEQLRRRLLDKYSIKPSNERVTADPSGGYVIVDFVDCHIDYGDHVMISDIYVQITLMKMGRTRNVFEAHHVAYDYPICMV